MGRGIWIGFALGLVLASADAGASAGSPPRRLLLLTLDTLRADHVGAYGGPVATPSLDRLASEGALFEDASTPVPSTAPAHASLMTGLHPWRHGTLANAVPLDAGATTVAERLADLGVATAAFVSSFIVDRRFGFGRGFATYSFDPTETYTFRGERRERFWSRGEHTVDAAMSWVTENADQSWFLWVHLFDPHTPYRPPVGYAVSPSAPVDMRGKSVPKGVRSRRQLEELNRAYQGEVAYTDAQLGRLIERLRILGILDSTAVIVTADHGEGLGDHGLLEHGRTVFQELLRVPLIVRAPGVSAGRRLRGLVQLEDLAPTILDWFGAAPSGPVDGVDLWPWLRGEVDASPREWVVGRRREFRRLPDLFFARRGSQKWIGPREGAGEVFDLDRDPREQAGRDGVEPPEALRDAWLVGSKGRVPDPDPEVQRALEALGYTEP